MLMPCNREFQSTGIDKSISAGYPEHPGEYQLPTDQRFHRVSQCGIKYRMMLIVLTVIFTKRATSIVGQGHPIYTHPEVTKQVDYEGELGIIIGKGGLLDSYHVPSIPFSHPPSTWDRRREVAHF